MGYQSVSLAETDQCRWEHDGVERDIVLGHELVEINLKLCVAGTELLYENIFSVFLLLINLNILISWSPPLLPVLCVTCRYR